MTNVNMKVTEGRTAEKWLWTALLKHQSLMKTIFYDKWSISVCMFDKHIWDKYTWDWNKESSQKKNPGEEEGRKGERVKGWKVKRGKGEKGIRRFLHSRK